MSAHARNDTSRPRVLVVALNFAPEPSGTAPFTTDATDWLAGTRHEVTVLSGLPHYPGWAVLDGYSHGMGRRERRGDVSIRRVWHYTPAQPTLVTRLLYEASFVANSLIPIARARADVAILIIPSLLSSAAATFVLRLKKVPTLVWVQDSVHRGATQSGIAKAKLSSKILHSLESYALRHSFAAVAISPAFEDEFRHYTKTVLMRNWTRHKPTTVSIAQARDELGWPTDHRVVLHAGNMGKKQGLDAIVSAAEHSARAGHQLLYVLAGDGSERSSVERLASGMPNLRLMPSLSEERYATALRAADVLLISERAGVKDMSMPSKMSAYMSAERPIVAFVDADGRTAAEVGDHGLAIVVDNNKGPVALARVLAELDVNSSGTVTMVARASGYAQRETSVNNLVVLERLIADALSPRGRT